MNQKSHLRARSHRMYRRSQITALLVAAFMLAAPSVAHGATVNAAAKMASQTSSARLAAAAAAALPSCPASTFCTFQNANYNANGGTRWNFAYSSHPHNTWFWIGAGANDKISSFYNHRAWATWQAKNCPADSTFRTFAFGGGAEPDLTVLQWAADGSPVNDSLSALALATNNNNPPNP